MTSTAGIVASLLFIIAGVALIKLRTPIANKAAILYKKLGIEFPEDLYTKQLVFIGVMLMIIGFLGATGLLTYL